MREIKFRAWIKDYALMTDVNFLNIDYKEIVVMIDENDYEFGCGEYELMQYTGLKDKNGVEIYEGDLYQNPLGSKMKIIFEIREASFMGKSLKTGQIFSLLNFNGSLNGEIIGNIYENPELLEESE